MFTEPGDITKEWETLARDGGRIVLLVFDGGGGLRHPKHNRTALEAAHTPQLDRLATGASCGMLETVGPGITPGSGPGHLALFGYDPLRYRIGRGILSALGIDFPLREGDVAARVNFATRNGDGRIIDRRAGRIASEENRRLCERICSSVRLDFDGEFFLETVREHRAVLVLRGGELGDNLNDTDPQQTGVPPTEPRAADAESEITAELVSAFLHQAEAVLDDEITANTLLLRGFERYAPWPSLRERFGLKGLCIASYPMYRGLSRLLGMDVVEATDAEATFEAFARHYGDAHDFYFVHVKSTDSRGEDADFDAKVAVLEAVDAFLPRLIQARPDVIAVTSDHSTPAVMGEHSWHPVPVLIQSRLARVDAVQRFDEYHCLAGALGLRPGVHLMGLMLANAGRLKKFGA